MSDGMLRLSRAAECLEKYWKSDLDHSVRGRSGCALHALLVALPLQMEGAARPKAAYVKWTSSCRRLIAREEIDGVRCDPRCL